MEQEQEMDKARRACRRDGVLIDKADIATCIKPDMSATPSPRMIHGHPGPRPRCIDAGHLMNDASSRMAFVAIDGWIRAAPATGARLRLTNSAMASYLHAASQSCCYRAQMYGQSSWTPAGSAWSSRHSTKHFINPSGQRSLHIHQGRATPASIFTSSPTSIGGKMVS